MIYTLQVHQWDQHKSTDAKYACKLLVKLIPGEMGAAGSGSTSSAAIVGGDAGIGEVAAFEVAAEGPVVALPINAVSQR